MFVIYIYMLGIRCCNIMLIQIFKRATRYLTVGCGMNFNTALILSTLYDVILDFCLRGKRNHLYISSNIFVI